MIVTITVVITSFFFLLLMSRRDSFPILPAAAAIFLISAQFVLIEQSFFGIPVRLLAFALAFLVSIYLLLKNGLKGQALRAAGLWVFYAVSIFISSVVNGGISGADDVLEFFSRYLFALVGFILIFYAARSGGGKAVCAWMFFIAVVNFIFAAGQNYIGGVFYDLHDVVFPLSTGRAQDMIDEGLISSFGYAPGLSQYSISTGYVLTVFGFLGFSLASLLKTRWARYLTYIFVLMLSSLGALFILSRSTLLLSGAMVIMLFAYLSLAEKITAFLVMMSGVAFYLMAGSGGPSFAGLDITRLTVLTDDSRVDLIEQSLQVFFDSPIFGGFHEAIKSGRLILGAHNFIINGLVYHGIFAFFPMLIFLYSVLSDGFSRAAKAQGRESMFVAATFIALLGYLLKSLFHNESIVTSGIQFLMVYALFLGWSVRVDSKVGYDSNRKLRV